MILKVFCLVCIFRIVTTFRIGTPSNRIVDHFTYTPRNGNEMENGNGDVQWEFLVIGRRVPWNEAQAICPIYGHPNPLSVSAKEEMGYDDPPDSLTRETETDTGSTLAVLDDDTRDWLARMVSESNYRYDGLWIGGQRKDVSGNWTWIDTRKKGSALIPGPMIGDHPALYAADNDRDGERNCLVFDRLDHDAPALVPENCRHRKPFICMRPGKKKSKENVAEGSSVLIDDQRYTLYQVVDEEDETLRVEGVRKVNGGGVTWGDARLECKKRGKHLAMIFTNEAATAIASAMLRSRPSMESLWLGGRSADGTDWTWISSGVTLPSKRSNITSYPPWLDGHPVLPSENADYYQQGRCLILDRHLCAERTAPVFLDLDCEKKRPFLCQDEIPEMMKNDERDILLDNKQLAFSRSKMTWIEGEAYCQRKLGRIASITDAKTLSVVLEKMTELALDHTWVGGRTTMSKDGWKWVDENGETLSRSDLGAGSSWCLDGSSWPYADREVCLNLDREGHGTPLFYGLPCNTTSQYVLCNYLSARRSMQPSIATEVNESKLGKSLNIQQQAADLAGRVRKLARDERSGLLFVMDDSLSVLNAWFAEEMKLAATILRRYFPLSHNHPMGMITFSERSKVVLPFNQTDICNSLLVMSKDVLENRAERVSQDRDGAAGKTTNLISAALTAVDVVRASNIQRVIVVFVTDGEHMVEGNDKENLHIAVESLQNLRNDGHEAFAIVISQGQKRTADYNVIEELFSASLKGERNLYFVKDYDGLAEMNLALNSTDWKEDYAAECGEIQWIIPKDIELLAHLLNSRK